MKRNIISCLFLLFSVFMVNGQTVSDTSYIRIVEMLNMETRLNKYRSGGDFWNNKSVLVVSDFRTTPLLRKSEFMPLLMCHAPEGRYAICQYTYIKDNDVRSYIVPEEFIESNDSLYIGFRIVNQRNEKVSGSFVYKPSFRGQKYYHCLKLSVRDENGNLNTNFYSGTISSYAEHGCRLYYQTESEIFNLVLKDVLNDENVKNKMRLSSKGKVYPLSIVYLKNYVTKLSMDGFAADSAKKSVSPTKSILVIKKYKFDEDETCKIEMVYNDIVEFKLKLQKEFKNNHWVVRSLLVENKELK